MDLTAPIKQCSGTYSVEVSCGHGHAYRITLPSNYSANHLISRYPSFCAFCEQRLLQYLDVA